LYHYYFLHIYHVLMNKDDYNIHYVVS